ncbi:hypothetical protein [Chryseobacterium sp. CT-SW4]|uniref:hypothetical protein n=1 Tax=Chryseobacterium sp. SW-1 TaxID=3157343 RepID=UPI003B027530
MRLVFKKVNKASLMLIIGICVLFLPFLFTSGTIIIEKKQYMWLMYFGFLILFTIFFLWYKIYYEIIFSRINNNILYYTQLFFIKKSIRIEDIKGFKIGNEGCEFFVLYDKNDKKLFVVRTDFYSNYEDFIDTLNIKNLGVYHTVFQRIIAKIFRKEL